MADTRSRSIRIADDVWEAIQALPGKTDDALRAILVTKAKPKIDTHSEVNRWFRETWKRLDEIYGLAMKGVGVSDDAAKLFVKMTVPSSAPAPVQNGFPIQCRHCGERGHGSTKFATICFGCKSGGHTNDPRDCPACQDRGTGAL